MKILHHRQIQQKIQRLAIEILENNYEETGLILAGINNNGMTFARLILAELQLNTTFAIQLTQIRLNPAAPLSQAIEIGLPAADLAGQVIIVVDDVGNTGRTLFYACKPLMEVLPKKIEMAVLVDRKHKSFPVKVDYVGLSLATTLKEHIDVKLQNPDELEAFLREKA